MPECPQCGSEYEESALRCPGCGEAFFESARSNYLVGTKRPEGLSYLKFGLGIVFIGNFIFTVGTIVALFIVGSLSGNEKTIATVTCTASAFGFFIVFVGDMFCVKSAAHTNSISWFHPVAILDFIRFLSLVLGMFFIEEGPRFFWFAVASAVFGALAFFVFAVGLKKVGQYMENSSLTGRCSESMLLFAIFALLVVLCGALTQIEREFRNSDVLEWAPIIVAAIGLGMGLLFLFRYYKMLHAFRDEIP